jgi:AcrR family transcriptional regulator
MAYNLFRVSCIRQGVYARSLDGTASNVRAADSGKLVRPAAELAWQIVEASAERRDEQAQAGADVVARPSRRSASSARRRGDSRRGVPQFAERGYPVVTVRDIMKACGLTQGALYNHFKSKDELLHDIIASTQASSSALPAGGGGRRRRSARQARGLRACPYVMRHCRLRVEALVANREIGWLDADASPTSAAAAAPFATSSSRSWRRASSRACSTRRSRRRRAISRRSPWRCSISGPMSRCGTVRRRAREEQMARLYADMALARGRRPALSQEYRSTGCWTSGGTCLPSVWPLLHA